jgi:hypothetical protein
MSKFGDILTAQKSTTIEVMKMTDAGDEEFVGSHEKADNGYGQNGFQGPASDLPGQHTTSDFLPQCTIPARTSDGTPDWQTRQVKADQYPVAHGMKARDDKLDFPTANIRKSSVSVNPKSFQR